MKKRSLKLAGILLSAVMLCGCAVNLGNGAEPVMQEETEPTEESAENEDEDSGKANDREESSEMPEEQDVAAELSQEDYEALYSPVIDEIMNTIEEGYDYEKSYEYLSEGLIERLMYGEKDSLPDEIGYWLEDYSGDGVPELLIGYSEVYETGEQEMHIEDSIVGVYTIKDGKPFMTIEGWARNSYRLMDDGHFYNIGSGGAMNTIIGECHLSEDGTEVIWDSFCFTEGRADGSLAIFSNDSGIADMDISDELDIGEEEFEQIMDEFELRCELIVWLPVRGYGQELNDIDQSYVPDDEAMYLFEDYYRDPTQANWKAFISAAPSDAVLFIITNPGDDLMELVGEPMQVDKATSDVVIAVSLEPDTKLTLEDGEVLFTDDGDIHWNPESDKLYEKTMDRGEAMAFSMVLPEGVPTRAMQVSTPDAEGMFLVATLSGEWDQHSKFITAE